MEKSVLFHSAILLLVSQTGTLAAQNNEPEDSLTMSHMVVVANKSPRPIQGIVGSVVSFTAKDIANNQAENFDDK